MVIIDSKKVILQSKGSFTTITIIKIIFFELSYPMLECINDKTTSNIANMSDLSWHQMTKNNNYQGGKTTKQTKKRTI